MATELTLKDQQVMEIGKSVSDAFTGLAPETVKAKSGKEYSVDSPQGKMIQAYMEKQASPFEVMMSVLTEMRDGIYQLVDKFSDSVAIENKQLDAQEEFGDNIESQQDAAALGKTEENQEQKDEGDKGPSMLDSLKEKASLADTSFKGLLVKGAIIGVLLGLATALKKYGKQIADAIAPIVDGIKVFYSYIKDDIGVLFDDIIDLVKSTFGGLFKTIKGIFGGDGELIKEGLAELLTLPTKFIAMTGKLVVGIIDALLGVFGVDPRPEWVQKLYDFFDELPKKVKEFYEAVIGFFTVTIPTKIQEAKDTVTDWFTDIKTGITGFFTDIKNFFTVTIPEKIAEIGKGITDGFTTIKDEIIGFAMAPFNKIKELMQSLLVGILESVEGLPFIGDKAKALKNSILGVNDAGMTEEEAVTGAIQTYGTNTSDGPAPQIQVNEEGSVIDPATGKVLEIDNEDSASIMAQQLNTMGQGRFEPHFVDPWGPFGEHYVVRKVGGATPSTTGADITPSTIESQGAGTTTTGGDLNAQSAEFAAAQGAGMGGASVAVGGSTSNTTTAISQNNVYEDTTTGDRTFNQSIG